MEQAARTIRGALAHTVKISNMQTLTDVKTMETEAGFNESTISNTKTNIDDTSPPLTSSKIQNVKNFTNTTLTPITLTNKISTTITKTALPAWAKPVPRSSLLLARMSAIAETTAAAAAAAAAAASGAVLVTTTTITTTTTTTVITAPTLAITDETTTNLLITRSSSPTIWARPLPVCSSGNMLRSVTLTNHSSTKFATTSTKPVALLKSKTITPSYTDCQIGLARNLPPTPTTSITTLSSQSLPGILAKNAAIITTTSHCSRALDSTTTASSTRPQTYAPWIGSSMHMHSGITTASTGVLMPTVTSIPLPKTTAIVTGSSISSPIIFKNSTKLEIMKTNSTTLITTTTARGATRNFSNTTSASSTTSALSAATTTPTHANSQNATTVDDVITTFPLSM